MSGHRINAELAESLIVNGGFNLASDRLEELFEQENLDLDRETKVSRSNILLVEELGGTDKVISELKSDTKVGIDGSQQDIAARVQMYGSNERLERKVLTVCEMICAVFDDFILKILIAAAIVSMAIGIYNEGLETGWIEGTSILVAILIITVVTVSNDYSRQAQFLEIMKKDDIKTCRVIRQGNQMTIDTIELMVGDIIVISTGDLIPADAIVFETHDLSCSEAQLTGEPDAKRKEPITADNFGNQPCPFVLQGSLVESGTAKAVCLCVGNKTTQGKAGLTMNMEQDQTPLQAKLDTIANTIGKFGTYVAILTFIAITIRTLCYVFFKHQREFMDSQNLDDILEGFIVAVTIIVVAVPEGLPLAVAIALKAASGKMEEENNLVRKMESAETMGNANEICTDKTGTLTENKMTVVEGFFEDRITEGQTNKGLKSQSTGELVAQAICWNSSAFVETQKTGEKKTKGNVTDVGMIEYMTRSGFDCEEMIRQRDQEQEPLFTIPFSSARKRSTNVISHPSQPGMVRVYVKGAPDMLIPLCNKMVGADGEAAEMDDNLRDEILHDRVIAKFAAKCYRTILIAY
jgi:Ca2+ transporting ATPase